MEGAVLATWTRELAACATGTAFGACLCQRALDLGRAHAARLRLFGEGGARVLAEAGRGLALLEGNGLAGRALAGGEPLFEGAVCVLPLGGAVLELFGADEEALDGLTEWLPVLGLALEGVLAREARRGRGRTAEVVENLVRRLGGSLDLGEVLTATAESAARALGFERAFVGLYREVSGTTAQTGEVFAYGFASASLAGIQIGPHSFARLVGRGEPILFDRSRDHASPLAAGLADLAPERCLIVPLAARGRPLGVLYVDTRERGVPLGEDEVWLTLALAEQAALAIDNARLYEEESRKRRAAETLREVALSLAGSLRLADTLEKLLEDAQRLFQAQACAVFELQADGRTLRIRSALGLESEYVLRAHTRVGVGVVGRAVEGRARVAVTDVRGGREDAGSRYTRALLAAGTYPFRGVLGLPLAARGKTFGGLALYFAGDLDLDEGALSLSDVFAAQAALAIENARLYEEEVRREREAGVLLHLARLLGGGREAGALSEAAERAALAMNAERCLVTLFAEGGTETRELGVYRLSAGAGETARLSAQLGRGPRRLTRRGALAGANSALVVPICSGDQTFGLLYADSGREDAPSDRVLQLARAIADQIALTVRQERLLAALEREEARYRSLAEGVHDLILACDAGGAVSYANPATLALLGDVTGRPLTALIGEEWREVFGRAWQDCLSDPARGVTCEVEMPAPSQLGTGEPARLELRLSAVRRGRDVSGVLLVARDLSEQRRLAEEIARRGQALEAASARQLELRSYLALFTQAQEEERRRLSRELHDDTAQVLVAVGRRLDRLSRELPAPVRARAEEVRADLNAAIASVRRYARNLRPSVLDDLGLLPALEWLAAQASTPARLEVQGTERRLSQDAELAVFRLAQEALTNVDKHAGAASCALRVHFLDTEVQVTVADDGRGFDATAVPELAARGHLGLMGLRERVELAGGHLTLDSAPGAGTTLRFSLPG